MVITIELPDNSEILVKAGQSVEFSTAIAKIQNSQRQRILIAEILRIPNREIFTYLKKAVGSTVKKGELIAEKKTFLKTIKYLSDSDGIIKEIDHNEGSVVLSIKSGDGEKIFSYLKGEVITVKKSKVDIKVPDGQVFPIKESTENFGGEIVVVNFQMPAEINEKHIGNKIILAETLPSYDQAKIEALQVAGLITAQELPKAPSIPYAQLAETNDLKKIANLRISNCYVDKKAAKIYLYR